jgi:uncharacterized membrane protein
MNKRIEPTPRAGETALSAGRIWELDLLRGVCVALMVFDHLMFDLGFVFLQPWFDADGSGPVYALCQFARDFYWPHPLRLAIRMLVLAGFIGSCGISCSLSHSNLRRGLKLLAVALALTAFTTLLDAFFGVQQFFISFGILHLLAVSILVYAALQHYGPWPALILGSLVLLLALLPAPAFAAHNYPGFIIGWNQDYYSADYFPLIPYLGWFLVGATAGGWLYRRKRSFFPRRGQGPLARPFLWLGRHALLIYILHQPLIYSLLWGAGWLFGR